MKVNKFLKAGFAGLMLALMSCSSPSFDGTYEGVLPAADCPGVYVLLTVNGDKYELLEKYLLHPETFVTYGKVESADGGRGLRLDNRMELKVEDGNLMCQGITLKRISSETFLPEFYKSVTLKDYQTGEDVVIRFYEREEKKYADFSLGDKDYKLKLEMQNDSVSEYRNGESCLKLLAGENASSRQALFDCPEGVYSLAQITPTYVAYTLTGSKGNSDVPAFYDALYYNEDTAACVKLITADPAQCYTLPQTEASAKTAVYTDGKVEWNLGNYRNATLVIDGNIYNYKE